MTFKNWLFKKTVSYPTFWTNYLAQFNKKLNSNINETRFVALDTETTGLNKKEDRILSIGAVSIINKTIEVKNTLELYLEQDIFKRESVEIHGLMKHGNETKVCELDAIKLFLEYIGNSVLIAHHANFDRSIINQMLQRHGLGKLKNKFIDTATLYSRSLHIIYQDNIKPYSLDYLSSELNVPTVDRHTATGDALITALVFLKILARLDKRKHLNWGYLLK